jgi:hypothetical protein
MPTSAKFKVEYDGPSGIDPSPKVAIWGDARAAWGIAGTSALGSGVLGASDSLHYAGVAGYSSRSAGVYGGSDATYGVHGYTANASAAGVCGEANWDDRTRQRGAADGILGVSGKGNGVVGSSTAGEGLLGESESGYGMLAVSADSDAVVGYKNNSRGVAASLTIDEMKRLATPRGGTMAPQD